MQFQQDGAERKCAMKIAMAQMEVIPGHPDINTKTILRMTEEAKAAGAAIVIFPEMAVPGYLLGDTWEETAFLRDCESYGKDIIHAAQGIVIFFGNVAIDWKKKNNDGRVRKYNAFFAAKNGTLIQPDNMPYPFTIKTLMPNYREFDDTRHFFSLQKLARELQTTPDALLSPITLKTADRTYRIGCLLCEDGWSDDYELAPLNILQHEDVDLPPLTRPERTITATASILRSRERQRRRCIMSPALACKTMARRSTHLTAPARHTTAKDAL